MYPQRCRSRYPERCPEVRGIKKGGASRIQLGNEDVVGATAVTRLEGPTSHREVCRTGPACHVRVAGAVDGDAEALVIADAAEIRGVNEPRPRRIHLRYEGIAKDAAAVETRVEGASDRREVTRKGLARHVGISGGVDRDRSPGISAHPPEVRGVEEHRINDERPAGSYVSTLKPTVRVSLST